MSDKVWTTAFSGWLNAKGSMSDVTNSRKLSKWAAMVACTSGVSASGPDSASTLSVRGRPVASLRAVSRSVAGTKTKEKVTLHVQNLHTCRPNHLKYLLYQPNPSSAQQKTYVLDNSHFFSYFQGLKTCTRSPFVRHDIRQFSHFVPLSVHTACTKKRPPIASINKLASGKWRVQVRIKGHYLSDSFSLRKDAEMWARRMAREIDLGQKPAPKHKDGIKTFSDLIDLHIADMKEVGKEIGRSKGFSPSRVQIRIDTLPA